MSVRRSQPKARKPRNVRAFVLGMLLTATIAGCGSSPPERFFTLAGEGTGGGAPSTSPLYSLVVGPVTVPEAVDRPQLVLRSGANRVEIKEQARWAAPLKSEIPRVVAEQLARLLDGARTATSTQRATTVPDYRVLLDIQRFDTSFDDGVRVEALWSIRAVDGAPVHGRSSASEPGARTYEELVAAHSRALSSVSRDIAAAILALRGQR